MSDEGGRFGAECPRCEAPIEGEERSCPECGLAFVDEEGGLSDEAIEAMMASVDEKVPESALDRGDYMPGYVRLVIALAITVPLATVGALIVLAIVPLPAWVAVTVLGMIWLFSTYVLANFAVASLIVANGLLLTGGLLAGAPLLIRAGRALLGTGSGDVGALGANVHAAEGLFLGLGIVVLGVGVLVRRHAVATRARWERQREHPEEFLDPSDAASEPDEE